VTVTVQGPVDDVVISGIPSSWTVNRSRNDSAAVTPDGQGDEALSQGVVNWMWMNEISGAEVSATFDIPSGTQPDNYIMNVSAESGDSDKDETSVAVTVRECPAEPIVCEYGDDSGNVDISDLQNAVDDFILPDSDPNSISIDDLRVVIEAFISS